MDAEMLGWVILTALFSSVFTIVGALLVYKFLLANRINDELNRMGDAHETQLRQALEKSAVEMLPEFRSEVIAGFEDAGNDMLPEFRREVEDGFKTGVREVLPEFRKEVTEGVRDALVGVASVDFVDKTAQNVARKSGKILESGFNALFGKKPPKT